MTRLRLPLPIPGRELPSDPKDNERDENQPIVAVTCFFCWYEVKRTISVCNAAVPQRLNRGTCRGSRVSTRKTRYLFFIDSAFDGMSGASMYGQSCMDSLGKTLYSYRGEGWVSRIFLFPSISLCTTMEREEPLDRFCDSACLFLSRANLSLAPI